MGEGEMIDGWGEVALELGALMLAREVVVQSRMDGRVVEACPPKVWR